MKNRNSNQGDEVEKMEDSIFVDYSVCKSELMPTGYYDTKLSSYCLFFGI